MRPELNFIQLERCTILEQLRIEEALLRADDRNWCLFHQNPHEAIVMGISAQPEQVVDFSKWHQKPVPIIRRFSGGGTVFIDENCFMATFICNQEDLDVPSFPQPVFQWSEAFYQPVFVDFSFSLRENDYVIGQRKFGGNAQYMTKQRWLHHSSFLWDYEESNMMTLKMPPKMPQYRAERPHHQFLCKLNEHFSDREEFTKRFVHRLQNHFNVLHADITEVQKIAQRPHRKATVEIKKGC